jgi:hypothetical protein
MSNGQDGSLCECGKQVVSVGMPVPNFEMEVYDPADREFGKISLDAVRKQ